MTAHKSFEKVTFEPGALLFDEGQAGDAAYLVIGGDVEIRTGMRTGNPRILAKRGKGAVVGEMALLDRRPRMAAVVALNRVEAIRISREEFLARLDAVDPVIRSVIEMLVARVRDLSEEVADLKRMDWRPGGGA